MSLNKVMLIGNVGRDPEVRHLSGDSSVARFPLATSEKFKNRNGELQEQTEWHNVVCWRGLAELSEKYIRKGSRLYIEGRIRTNSWTDKNTEEKKYSTEIIADSLIFLDSKPQNSPYNSPGNTSRPAGDNPETNNNSTLDNSDNSESIDDLPF
jgi:single-strand DNA-binding protein